MRAAVVGFCVGLAACGSCGKGDEFNLDAGSPATTSSSPLVVAEPLPRCRKGTERLPIPGDEVIVGDVAVGPSGLLAGIVRVSNGKRVASVLRTPLALDNPTTVDIGTPIGDDPPPSPRWNGTTPWVAFIAGHPVDAGAKQRELRIAKLDDLKTATSIVTQADESTAFDVAWTDTGAGLVDVGRRRSADGNATPARQKERGRRPRAPVRGIVKVQPLVADGDRADRVARHIRRRFAEARRSRFGRILACVARAAPRRRSARASKAPASRASSAGSRSSSSGRDRRAGRTGPAAPRPRKAGRSPSSSPGAGDDLIVVIQDEIAASGERWADGSSGAACEPAADKPESRSTSSKTASATRWRMWSLPRTATPPGGSPGVTRASTTGSRHSARASPPDGPRPSQSSRERVFWRPPATQIFALAGVDPSSAGDGLPAKTRRSGLSRSYFAMFVPLART